MSLLLLDFVKDAAKAGKTKPEITAVLKEAGWSDDQLRDVWRRFHDVPFPLLVPRPTAYASPRLTMVNLFYCVVLYITIYCAVAIVFTFLDYNLPDGLGHRAGLFYNSYRSIGEEIREYLACVIVSAPLVYFSARMAHTMMASVGQFIPAIRLKLLNLTLLIAALIMLCNFIGLVYYFLSGELSMRFVSKVIILSGVCAGLYFYFKPEMQHNENKV